MQEPDGDSLQLLTPQRFAWIANVLFVVFSISVIDAAVPLRLLDMGWQLTLISTLLNFAIFPLIGLGFVHLAADINPGDDRIHRRLGLLSQLAVPVSFGFLLLTLIHPLLVWYQHILIEKGQFAPLRRTEQNITNIRSILQNSRSTEEIFKNLQAIQAPPVPEQYASLNLAELQLRMLADLKNAEQQLSQLRQQAQATIQQRRGTSFDMVLRSSFLSLAFSLGFASLAQRRSSVVTLLQECQEGFEECVAQVSGWFMPKRESADDSSHVPMTSYIDEIDANAAYEDYLEEDSQSNLHSRPSHEWFGMMVQHMSWLMPAPKPPQGSIDDQMTSFIEELNANDESEEHPDDLAQPDLDNGPLHGWGGAISQRISRFRPPSRPSHGSIQDEIAYYYDEINASELNNIEQDQLDQGEEPNPDR